MCYRYVVSSLRRLVAICDLRCGAPIGAPQRGPLGGTLWGGDPLGGDPLGGPFGGEPLGGLFFGIGSPSPPPTPHPSLSTLGRIAGRFVIVVRLLDFAAGFAFVFGFDFALDSDVAFDNVVLL